MVKLKAITDGLIISSAISIVLSLVFPVVTNNIWSAPGEIASTISFSILGLGNTGIYTAILLLLTVATTVSLLFVFRGNEKITQLYLYLPIILFLVFHFIINFQEYLPDFHLYVTGFLIIIMLHGYITVKRGESIYENPQLLTGVLVAASIIPFFELILSVVSGFITIIQFLLDQIVVFNFTIPSLVNIIIAGIFTLLSMQIYRSGYEELKNDNTGNAQKLMVVPFVLVTLLYLTVFWLGLIAYNENQAIVGLILTGALTMYVVRDVYENRNLGKMALLPAFLSFILLYQIDLKVRMPLIRNAFLIESAFGHPAPPAIGYYFILLAFFLLFWLSRIKVPFRLGEDETNLGIEDDVSLSGEYSNPLLRVAGGIKNRFWGPTLVQYLAFHVVSLITMMLSYGWYFDDVSMLDGPSYYMELIYTYGLNRDAEVPSIVLQYSWVFAPAILLSVGLVLFFITAGGFAPNGAVITDTVPEASYTSGVDYEIWAYFSQPVPYADVFFVGAPKYNFFYILVVFMPFIVGAIIGSILNHFLFDNDNKVKFFSYLRLFIVVAFYFGYTFASMTAPVLIVPGGIITSIFLERRSNRFIIYRWTDPTLADAGAYAPLSQFWIILFLIVPLIVVAVIIEFIVRLLLSGKLLEKKENVQVVGRVIDESATKLPWDERREKRSPETTSN